MFNHTITNNHITFSFDPKMDSKACVEIESNIKKKLDSHSFDSVIFDLKNVEYIASAFIRICVSTVKTMTKEKFKIINTQPIIKKTFKIAGLDTILNIE